MIKKITVLQDIKEKKFENMTQKNSKGDLTCESFGPLLIQQIKENVPQK